MKINRKQLRQIILEALSDNSGRRIVRPSTGPRFPNAAKPLHRPPETFEKSIEDLSRDVKEGTPALALMTRDIQFDPNKEKSLTAESPFVGGSPNFHATYSANYTEEDLKTIIKKIDPDTGLYKYTPIRGDLPDIKEGDYVIVWSLFQTGKLGVAEVLSSYNITKTLDGKMVTIPLLTIKTITTGRLLSKVGKAFVKKIAGSRSLEKAMEYETDFNPIEKGYRE